VAGLDLKFNLGVKRRMHSSLDSERVRTHRAAYGSWNLVKVASVDFQTLCGHRVTRDGSGRFMMFWIAYGSASGGLVRQRVSLHAWVAIRPPTEFGAHKATAVS
jgi:hypothetical protein